MFKHLALAALLVATLAGCPPETTPPPPETWSPRDAVPAGQARAAELDGEGPLTDHPSGEAKPGDIILKNEKVWFAIEAVRESSWYIPFGGGILDADLVRPEGERGYDFIDEFQPISELSPVNPEKVEIINDGQDGQAAVVRVTGSEGSIPLLGVFLGRPPTPLNISFEIDYILAPGASHLEIVSRIFNEGDATIASIGGGDFGILDDDESDPFTLPGGFIRGQQGDTPEILGLAHDERAFAAGVFADQGFEMGGAGILVAALGKSDSIIWVYASSRQALRPGEEMTQRRYLAMGRSVSEVIETRQEVLGIEVGEASGQVTAGGAPVAGAQVGFVKAGTDPAEFATQAITDAEGKFKVMLPPGDYIATALAEGRDEDVEVPVQPRDLAEGYAPSAPAPVSVSATAPANVALTLAPAGRVSVKVVDTAGALLPSKLTFIDGNSQITHPIFGERRSYPGLGVRKVAWTVDGEREIALRPGTYQVFASRGFDYEVDAQLDVVVSPGETTQLSFALAQPVDRTGFVTIDTHMHGAASIHGETSLYERLVTAAGEGLDIHLATEHDRVIDYRPLVAELELGAHLMSIPSTEMSTIQWGHHNAWPIEPKPDEVNYGSPQWWNGMTMSDIYAEAETQGAKVIQVNHGGGDKGYFPKGGFDIATGTAPAGDGWSWGFNSMEIHNGKGQGGRAGLLPIWFSLLNHGRWVTPMAVSDSHQRIPEAGTGRTYVLAGGTNASEASTGAVVDGVLGMRTVPSTGIFATLETADGGLMGDLVPAGAGGVTLKIKVQAPSWMQVNEVELIANGEVVSTFTSASTPAVLAPAQGGAIWFEHSVTVDPAIDTWYLVQAKSLVDMAPIYPGLTPWAMTSPIFVDANGNQAFDPPN